MTEQTMTCQQLEDRLADYLEGDVTASERRALDAHADSCERCGALVRDLRAISATAAALPPIEPPPHVWDGIRARIGDAEVVPIASRRRRRATIARGLAAAVVLVLASSTTTYFMMRPEGTAGSTVTAAGGANVMGAVSDAGAARREDRAAAGMGVTTYDLEISRLRAVLRSRNADLDPTTLGTIERSLAVIDTAIAQARAALAKDPESRFLNEELTDALDKKVRLLRTAAMLPSQT